MTGWIHFENQTLIRRATFVGSAVQVALGIRDDPGVRVQAVGWGLEIVKYDLGLGLDCAMAVAASEGRPASAVAEWIRANRVLVSWLRYCSSSLSKVAYSICRSYNPLEVLIEFCICCSLGQLLVFAAMGMQAWPLVIHGSFRNLPARVR